MPHSVLIDDGWGAGADVSFDSLYVFIRALRTKITRPGEQPLFQTNIQRYRLLPCVATHAEGAESRSRSVSPLVWLRSL